MSAQEDQGVTIAVSHRADEVLSAVDGKGWFKTQQACYVAAAALALALELPPAKSFPGLTTKWNRGGRVFDEWFTIASAFDLDGDKIIRLREYAEAGLELVAARLERATTLRAVFAPVEDDSVGEIRLAR